MDVRILPHLTRLRQLSQQGLLTGWRLGSGPLVASAGGPVALNGRGHIPLSQGHCPLWLVQEIRWPSHCGGYEVAGMEAQLALRWWAEQADIYIDGQRVQSGDLFDCFGRVRLTKAVRPGERTVVALRLVSPSHDQGALVRSQLTYERPQVALPEPSFVADELTVLAAYLQRFAPEQLPKLGEALAALPWAQLSQPGVFDAALAHLRQQLQPLAAPLQQHAIHCLGHAHLDMAWLWPVADTWRAAERTFESVLALQQDFPELLYTHSTPALFDWVGTHRPPLLARIQEQVAAGRWHIDAGLWVEPEFNLIGGEAIARQILYGQRHSQQTFGHISTVAWLPDSFGFCWQLPQLLRSGGIRCFATQKLRWNDANLFPHQLCRWRGRDGSDILAWMLPPIGSDVEPVAMAEYAWDWHAATNQRDCLWLPGVGDHGGGPTRDMLETFRRWQASPFFPTLDFAPMAAQVEAVETAAPPLPEWNDELYLELHRGCYTTHADQKWYNRRSEDRLYQAELISVIAECVAELPYPQAELETAWKQVLFNQFHDILPGSAIPEVFVEANRDWQAALSATREIIGRGLDAIATHLPLTPPVPDAQPWLIFNPLSSPLSELVPLPGSGQIFTASGQPLLTQPVAAAPEPLPNTYPPQLVSRSHQLVQLSLPPVGYTLLWHTPTPPSASQAPSSSPPSSYLLQNPYLCAHIDPATGDIAHLYDTLRQRPLLSGPGNQLQGFRDSGQYWDAWNIAPDYGDHPLPPTRLLSLEWVETGPLRQRLRVVRQLQGSTFTQDYVLDAHSPLLRIETTADWQETQVIVKASFPFTFAADHCTCGIPFGAIERPTRPQTPAEQAKWEVPILGWADLSASDCGVTLLSDSKHGLDIQPQRLRLTLLKAPLWPNPEADRGPHRFTYGLYVHGGDWRQESVQAARALQQPPIAHAVTAASQPVTLPTTHSFFNSGPAHLAALKRSETGAGYIARLVELRGATAPLDFSNNLGLEPAAQTDLLESQSQPLPAALTPWQVLTLTLAPQ